MGDTSKIKSKPISRSDFRKFRWAPISRSDFRLLLWAIREAEGWQGSMDPNGEDILMHRLGIARLREVVRLLERSHAAKSTTRRRK